MANNEDKSVIDSTQKTNIEVVEPQKAYIDETEGIEIGELQQQVVL